MLEQQLHQPVLTAAGQRSLPQCPVLRSIAVRQNGPTQHPSTAAPQKAAQGLSSSSSAPSAATPVLICTANTELLSSKLPARMTPSILCCAHNIYYLFQFKRDHCRITLLLTGIYIYICSKQNTHLNFKSSTQTGKKGRKIKTNMYALILSFRQHCKSVSIRTTAARAG